MIFVPSFYEKASSLLSLATWTKPKPLGELGVLNVEFFYPTLDQMDLAPS